MGKKVLSVRIDEELIEQINYFCGVLGISQADFVTSALVEKVERQRFEREGGLTLTVPNPQRFVHTKEQAEKIMKEISDVANRVTVTNCALDGGLNEIVVFYLQRLFKDSDEDRKRFENNFYNDLQNLKGGEK